MINMIANMAMFGKSKLMNFLTKEDGDVNIVSMVVLIGIAVVLAIVFKDAISSLITTLIEQISGNATDAISTD